MFRKKFLLTACIALMLSQIASCSFKNSSEASVNESSNNTNNTEIIDQHDDKNIEVDEKEKKNPDACKMDKEKDNFYKLNEEVEEIGFYPNDNTIKGTLATYIIKEAKITTPEEVGIDIDHCEYCKIPDLISDYPKTNLFTDKDKLKNAKILYIKADIKKTQEDYIPHIDALTPHYKVDDYCYSVGGRAYLNYDNEVKDDGSIYMAMGQSKEVTAAWVVDPEILEIDNFDPANLYIVGNKPQDIRLPRDFIDLGLGEQ